MDKTTTLTFHLFRRIIIKHTVFNQEALETIYTAYFPSHTLTVYHEDIRNYTLMIIQ